ncbi:MAG: multicopper oxidase domain-containing protein, partial [Anaerolineae bacterium]|nr:multicopper oxidase domain-containing protein [Anaerolineae bacterium]
YHDHALGITRLNVYMGLAGFYIVRDPATETALGLPSGEFEIPLVIQDRLFDINGQLVYPVGGDNPTIHPFWVPEFFGDTMLVNGAVWPVLDVKPGKYRFRILNGSNARFYEMQMQNKTSNAAGPVFTQIGTDGGYLGAPAPMQRLIIAPGERCDVVIDFSAYAPGTEFILRNFGRSPYPKGVTPNPQTDGQIMKFRVVAGVAHTAPLPNVLNPSLTAFPSIGATITRTRTLTLNEIMGPGGPIEALLNLTKWGDAVSEIIDEGTTEMWRIVNLTGDGHPIHTHLTQFQLVSRQRYNVNNYTKAFDAVNPVTVDANGNITLPTYTEVDVTPFLQGPAFPAPANERGWKDTIRTMPGEVTTILVRAGQIGDGSPYPFDPSAAPGYVWHCHVLEHEDNEMMRPYSVNR